MKKPHFHRQIKSFVRREGRMTDAQKDSLCRLWPQYGLEVDDGPLDVMATFAREAPLILEIGFGMGTSLSLMAKANPDINYIGVEVHRPGVGALLQTLDRDEISNVRVYQDDAISVLKQCVIDNSLDGVQIFFPDPWPKRRHHKRRLIQPAFVEMLRHKLKIGGFIHLATDWEAYALHMLEVLSSAPGFVNEAKGGFMQERMGRPETKFERRGARLGHKSWDLCFKRLK